MKNKKADMGETITLIIATTIIFFILIIFFYLTNAIADFKFKKHAEVVADYSNKEHALISLQAFLQTPLKTEIGGIKSNILVKDLMRINTGSYDTMLQQEASEIFKPFGICYFISVGNLKSGNSNFASKMIILNLPVNSEKNVEVGLAVNSQCLENLK